jgi:phosphate acyltransferase
MSKITIAIDAMGGDNGISVTLPAAIDVLKKHKDLELVLVGDVQALEKHFYTNNKKNSDEEGSSTQKNLPQGLTFHSASQVVEMDESPSKALRLKKDSSMRVAIDLVKAGSAKACVSAGNTGALMVTSRFVLKTIPGIDRPAIVALIPTNTPGKDVFILDLGANVDASPQNLYQFALMGSILAKTLVKIENPRVALLNVGEEEIKGNSLIRETVPLFTVAKSFNYTGFIEGDEIFKNVADVIVCDGFVGNVLLKTTEGAIKLIAYYAKKAFTKNIFTKLIALIALPVLRGLAKSIDPDRYNGAIFIGLQGIVIKSHGGANKKAFARAIEEAILAVEKDIPNRIAVQVKNLIETTPV